MSVSLDCLEKNILFCMRSLIQEAIAASIEQKKIVVLEISLKHQDLKAPVRLTYEQHGVADPRMGVISFKSIEAPPETLKQQCDRLNGVLKKEIRACLRLLDEYTEATLSLRIVRGATDSVDRQIRSSYRNPST